METSSHETGITIISISGKDDPEKSLDSLGKEGECQESAGTVRCAASQLPHESISYPEGGSRAWGVALGAFFIQFSSFGYVNAFGVYQDYYTRVYMTSHSASAISWIGSISAFFLLSSGLVVGRLFDRGYCMSLLYSGAFLMSLSLFMLSFVKENQYFGALLCQGIGLGLGTGLMFVPSFGVVSQYFDKRRALVMTTANSGVAIGSVVTPIMVNSLLKMPNLSFAMAVRINAGFATAILILACCLIRPRLPPPEKQPNVINCLKRFSKDGAYIMMTIGFTFFGMALFFPIFFLQLAAIEHGLGETFAFYSLVILNGCGFFGRVGIGLMTYKIGVDYLATAATIMCGGVVFAFVAIGSVESIVLVGVIYGFSFGMLVAGMAPLTSSLTVNMEEIGLRLGIAFAFTGFGELIGPPIMGALLTGYRWWRPATFSAILLFAAAACFATIRVIVNRRKWKHNHNTENPKYCAKTLRSIHDM